ncbi:MULTISPECIES: hypothetical protein [Clostridium]|jgi:hypothetical protein|uniref:Uncharacterized protein n=1 Tax=Clostridium saccharoperbutylacetonicum N1-4(HMT) TaxID=931276 RepID=M1MYZ8_9CLOT|nr:MULTISPECIES: hypothetical protein [Clostridium]AGF56627.1 hypothetical protein Cspa_c28640 [Clostridium saccharoperbutylacetonicum N1-4(HMT)]AQR95301.1 hypothetical protein CLSAP_26170 [Clostridium saccharoperbutylacetonicum]NRT62622.1 hypothetical protein [Clostridium saccharoperbutylacetonicum]NSB25969.1 hypothetical protein [Clostridium saccharoperbutylacetonicum]NSB31156.1 hypothetical protein [Clostridium saccharoperbutylacetonicum]
MGNLIKINMYAESKQKNGTILDLKRLEANIATYNIWLENNHREDKIETYEEFLQII